MNLFTWRLASKSDCCRERLSKEKKSEGVKDGVEDGPFFGKN